MTPDQNPPAPAETTAAAPGLAGAARPVGALALDRCPWCGKWQAVDADGWHDMEDREDSLSLVVVFCSEDHANRFHNRKAAARV